ncbi:ATP-binding protein, partial [Streptomyces sp. NPDC002454]
MSPARPRPRPPPSAGNFRSLRDVTVPLGPLTVLVRPSGVGKSNVLKVFDFLAD